MNSTNRRAQNVTVIYIGGYGRSGSTILDVILGNHPAFFGAGELTHAFRLIDSQGLCSCGALFKVCPFWGAVKQRVPRDSLGMDFGALAEMTKDLEDIVGKRKGQEKYVHAWGLLLRAIFEESGAIFAVDSSKSTWKVARRIGLLKKVGIEIRLIHLVRNPLAVMWSIQRGSNRLLEQKEDARLRGGMVRGLASWVSANLLFERYQKRTGFLCLRVRYEDLVADPAAEARKIGDWLQIGMDPIIKKISNYESLSPGHGLSGNRVRRQGEIRIHPDHQWKKAMPRYGSVLSLLIYPVARRYGYSWEDMIKR